MTKTHTPAAADPSPALVDAKRREIAVEHILFGTVRFLAEHHPELLDELDSSLDHLWDREHGEARDDEAVRDIARRMLKSLRATT